MPMNGSICRMANRSLWRSFFLYNWQFVVWIVASSNIYEYFVTAYMCDTNLVVFVVAGTISSLTENTHIPPWKVFLLQISCTEKYLLSLKLLSNFNIICMVIVNDHQNKLKTHISTPSTSQQSTTIVDCWPHLTSMCPPSAPGVTSHVYIALRRSPTVDVP